MIEIMVGVMLLVIGFGLGVVWVRKERKYATK